MIDLPNPAARALLLAAQGLCRPPGRAATKDDVLGTIQQMGALQIDTIHVVARSPYLVLWSRLGDYDPRWLDELLAGGALFEQWSHEACFLPVGDYPLYRRLMLDGRGRARKWLEAHPEHLARVRAELRERGEVRSADFERTDGQQGSWWNWKPEKRALEALLSVGEVMVARRERFQRVYAPRERVLPDWDDAAAPSGQRATRALALKALRALGVATARWLPDYFRTSRNGVEALLEDLVEAGEAVRARVEGLDALAYIHHDNQGLAEAAAAGSLDSEVTVLLSPFDPVVWDRARTRALFGFDYRLECYTPAEKRRYGYYCLPVLHRGALVGRLDAKAHRQDRTFEVRALYLEPGTAIDDCLVAGLAGTLASCAAWHGTPKVAIRVTDPVELAEQVAARILSTS